MRMQSRPTRERGSMLIVAMGILTLVTLLAVTFGLLMSLEKKVATAYVDTVRSRVLAETGIQSAMGKIKEEIALQAFSDPTSPLIYNPDNDFLPDFSVPLEDLPPDRASLTQDLGGTYGGGDGVDRYRVKVIDCNTMININDKYPTLPIVLYGLGRAIERLQSVENPIPTIGKAQEIVAKRDNLFGGRFESKVQLKEIIGEQEYRLVRDYVTTHSWVDVKSVMPSRDSIFNPSESIKRGKVQFVLPEDTPPGQAEIVGFGGRAPINLNQAPKEVLVAILMPIGGRRAYHPLPNQPQPLPIDTGIPNIQPISGFEEEIDFSQVYFKKLNQAQWRPYQWVFFQPYWQQPQGLERAISFADLLIRERTGQNRTGNRQKGGFQSVLDFEQWIDNLPNSATAWLGPQDTGVIIPTESALGRWGPIKSHPDFRRWHYETVKSLIKANFNPNALVNSFNPSSAAYRPVDKANLLYPKAEELRKIDVAGGTSQSVGDFDSCQSVDFCYSTMGFFEITSLGEVAGKIRDVDSTVDASTIAAAEGTRPVYGLAKTRAVVQLMGVIRHTSQQDFERNDDEFNTLNRKRYYVRSYPENDIFWSPGDGTGRSSTGSAREACVQYGYVELDTAIGRPPGARPRRNLVPGGGGAARPEPLFELTMDKREAVSDAFKMQDVYRPASAGNQPGGGGNLAEPFGTAVYGQHERRTAVPTTTFVLAGGTAMPDGHWSSMSTGGRGTTSEAATLWYRAADVQGTTDPSVQGLSVEEGVVNVPMHTGSIEFWYKPDFEWSFWDDNNRSPQGPNPLFCGLLQTTHVMQNPFVNYGLGNNKEGVPTRVKQMFVFRNTSGDIRIVRLYSELIGAEGASFKQMPWLENPNPDDSKYTEKEITVAQYVEESINQVPLFDWPPKDLQRLQDLQKATYARVDYIIPYDLLRYWRGHEWHHIAISWDDTGGGGAGPDPLSYVRVFVDGNLVDVQANVNHRLSGKKDSLDGGAGEFVRLNHEPYPQNENDPRWPKDEFFIGAVHRRQLLQAGVFKFQRDVIWGANGTIDDVRVYRESIQESMQVARPTDRYVPGTYEQRMNVPFPGNVDRIRLGSFLFTGYVPKEYNDADPGKYGGGRLEVLLLKDGRPLQAFGAGGWVFNENALRGGFSVTADPNGLTPQGTPIYLNKDEILSYRVRFLPARNALGNVASPVLDDVTLTYFLPKAKVLLQEEVLD